MPRVGKATLRFVRALLSSGVAVNQGGRYVAGEATLDEKVVQGLISDGVLIGDEASCRPLAGTAQWVKRQMLDEDAYSAQHREEAVAAEGVRHNLAESPLTRLSAPTDGASFIKPHQREAGERFRRLVQRTQLQARVTMNYAQVPSTGSHATGPADISDMAADARRELARLHRLLPRECADVVLDVCGFDKGLQQIEVERGWPRRSAKLVLRIGLDCLAALYGLQESAAGSQTGRIRANMSGSRPTEFG